MILPDLGRAITGICQHPWHGETHDVVPRRKLVIRVLMPILAVHVVVQARHHHRSTGAAARRRGEGVEEHRPVGRNGVDGRRHRDLVTVAAQRRAFVIGDEEDDVPLGGGQRRCEEREQRDGDERASHDEGQVNEGQGVRRSGAAILTDVAGGGKRPAC